MKYFILLLFYFSSSFGIAQNLVPNSSFEDSGINCAFTYNYPLESNYLYWVKNWTSPTWGTPDILNTLCDVNCITHMPDSKYYEPGGYNYTFGSQLPRTGNFFAGFYTFGFGGCYDTLDYREYLRVKLITPLKVGYTYCAEMYVSKADNFSYASNNIGMAFCDISYLTNTYCSMGIVPQINETKIITDTSNWVKIGGTFVATSPNEYLIIGNFFNGNQTSYLKTGKKENKSTAYYFIDDISVKEYSPSTFSVIGKTTICPGEQTTFTANGPDEVWWSNSTYPNDTLSIGNSFEINSPISNEYIAHGKDCNIPVSKNVKLTILPIQDINLGKDTFLCQGHTMRFDAGEGFLNYKWKDNSSNHFLETSILGEYWVEALNENGCLSHDTVSILNEYNIPDIYLGNDTSICQLFPLSLGNFDYYKWSTGETNPEIFPRNEGVYWVEVGNKCGIDFDTIKISIADIGLPNLFTPNGDHLNESFEIMGNALGGELRIYNTWGGQVYRSDHYYNDWEAQHFSEGVYYYTYAYPGCDIKKGWVQIIR
jgi:hypothetical protein